ADDRITREAITALLDLCFEERRFPVNANQRDDSERIRAKWFGCLMPVATRTEVRRLLAARRFVILQGPPGTGKTTMALELLSDDYGGVGRSIQFHPNTTYETFVGGLAPEEATTQLGLHFRPRPGFLMRSARDARQNESKPYLLHVDEINRADLAKYWEKPSIYSRPNLHRSERSNFLTTTAPRFTTDSSFQGTYISSEL
ncbi:MAG: AAA family ATPase, partial [Candidatus Korobacteraceae bacterium]